MNQEILNGSIEDFHKIVYVYKFRPETKFKRRRELRWGGYVESIHFCPFPVFSRITIID